MVSKDIRNKLIIPGILILFTTVCTFMLYGIAQRPLVDYNIDSINANYLYSGRIEDIGVYVENRGLGDALVTVHLTGENITFVEKEHIKSSGSDAWAYLILPKERGKQRIVFYFEITEDAEEVCIRCSVDKRYELTTTTGIVSAFGDVRGYHPTECRYNKTGIIHGVTTTNRYTLMT